MKNKAMKSVWRCMKWGISLTIVYIIILILCFNLKWAIMLIT